MYNCFSVAATRKVCLRWTYVQIDCHTTKIRQPMAPLSAAWNSVNNYYDENSFCNSFISLSHTCIAEMQYSHCFNIKLITLCTVHIIQDFKCQFTVSVRSFILRVSAVFSKWIRFSIAPLCTFRGADSTQPPAESGLSPLKAAAGKLSGSCMLLLELNWKEERRNGVSSVSQWRSTMKKRRCHRQRSGHSSVSSMQW